MSANQDSPAAPAAADGLEGQAREFINQRFVFLPWKDRENVSTTFGELEAMLVAFARQAILGKHFGAAPEQGGGRR